MSDTKLMSEELLAADEKFANAVKQASEDWHVLQGHTVGLKSDNTHDVACRLIEAIAVIRRLREEN